MIKTNPGSKIYVLCPENYVTGGTELLHQLVHTLLSYNIRAYIVYFNISSHEIVDAAVPAEFSNYSINTTNFIDDNTNNVLVISETIVQKLVEFKRLQIILWWLSVNAFYSTSKNFLSLKDYLAWKPRAAFSTAYLRFSKLLKKSTNPFNKSISISDIASYPILNCYQSEYAHHFLLNKNFKQILPLTDFINADFLQSCRGVEKIKKRNVILYNPKKGAKFTKKLITASPHLTWVPLINMSRSEVVEKLQTSKLYVDFGEHPGKDRIPREAVLSGCCLLTGLDGSANFFEDVSIENYYKIDKVKNSLGSIIKTIEEILENYDAHFSNFAFYKTRIIKERQQFEEQVQNIFSVTTQE